MGATPGALTFAGIGLAFPDPSSRRPFRPHWSARRPSQPPSASCSPGAARSWGTNPAYGSGPLATIIQDVLTLLIYFGALKALV